MTLGASVAVQDQFRGKTWIFWAQFIASGALGGFAVLFGVLYWTGAMTDAGGRVRPEAGPPMVITGSFLLVVAALAAFNIVGRITPIIRCFREGIECNLVGATSLDRVPLVPGSLRLAWSILTLQGFRSQRVRILWPEFRGAEVRGLPMVYILLLHGTATNLGTGSTAPEVKFKQVAFKADPREVADALNRFAADPECRAQLATWTSSS
jgi:hypothetical protein